MRKLYNKLSTKYQWHEMWHLHSIHAFIHWTVILTVPTVTASILIAGAATHLAHIDSATPAEQVADLARLPEQNVTLPPEHPPIAISSMLLRTHARYFVNLSGKAVFLTGSHTWNNLVDNGNGNPPASFDFTAYLDFLQTHNHNFIRLWKWDHVRWSVGAFASEPLKYAAQFPYPRTGPGNAVDGGLKFNLYQFDQGYFNRLRQRVVDARARGIYVSIMLFEGWSSRFGDVGGHAFHANNNVNGINADLNGDGKTIEFYALQNSTITAIQEAYVKKVIDTVNDLDNVLYEISNEAEDPGSTRWQYHMINLIKDYEAAKPLRHLVGMTSAGYGGVTLDLFRLLGSNADWISPAQNGGDPMSAPGSKVSLFDTDHVFGVGGDALWVWKSFLRGHNVLYMDPYDNSTVSSFSANAGARFAMGDARRYADKMNLIAMTPQDSLSSSGYMLASSGVEYITLAANSSTVSVNLSASPANFSVEWFDPIARTITVGANVAGGTTRTFTAPQSKPNMVLYLKNIGTAPTAQTSATSNTTTGLIAHWTFNEGATNSALDSSGNGNSATLSGAQWTLGKFGNAISVNGTSASAPTSRTLNSGTITVSIWVYKSASLSFPSYGVIMARQRGTGDRDLWALYYDNYTDASQAYMFCTTLGCARGGSSANDLNQWVHLTATEDGTYTRLYKDGVLAGMSAPHSGLLPTDVTKVCLGAGANDSSFACNREFISGRLDDARIYDRALGSTDVAALYALAPSTGRTITALPPSSATSNIAIGLVGHWKFDDGATVFAKDSSGYGNTATLSGAQWTSLGRFGNALSVNRTSAFAAGSASLNPRTITVSTWVYRTGNVAFPGYGVIAGKQFGTRSLDIWTLFYDNYTYANQIYRFCTQLGCANGGSSFGDLNRWVHLVGTEDGTYTKLYRNGVLVAISPAHAGSLSADISRICLGGNANDATRACNGEFMTGALDDVRIYNRALSAADVAALYFVVP